MVAAEGDALWMLTVSGAPSLDATDLRRLHTSLMYPGPTALSARSGLRPGAVPASLSGSLLTVNACAGIIAPTTTPWTGTDGPYQWALVGGSHTIPGPDPALQRIDRLVIKIVDHEIDSSTFRKAISVLKTGTPGSGAPTVATGELSVGTITTPAAGSPQPIVLSKIWTVALGGILPVATASDLPIDGAYEGMYGDVADVEALARYSGSGWQTVASGLGYQYWQTVPIVATGTFTKGNYPGFRIARVRLMSGGGSGYGAEATTASQCSAGSGGQGGTYAESWVLESAMGTTVTVTIGAGGIGAAPPSSGTAGGTSSFGSLVIAVGGSAGLVGSATNLIGGTNGTSNASSSTGTVIIPGEPGHPSITFGTGISGVSTPRGMSGQGGNAGNGMGMGGRGRSLGGNNSGGSGTQYGGGGGGSINGGVQTALAGANGAIGVCFVDLFV